jgi:hypothetical protein
MTGPTRSEEHGPLVRSLGDRLLARRDGLSVQREKRLESELAARLEGPRVGRSELVSTLLSRRYEGGGIEGAAEAAFDPAIQSGAPVRVAAHAVTSPAPVPPPGRGESVRASASEPTVSRSSVLSPEPTPPAAAGRPPAPPDRIDRPVVEERAPAAPAKAEARWPAGEAAAPVAASPPAPALPEPAVPPVAVRRAAAVPTPGARDTGSPRAVPRVRIERPIVQRRLDSHRPSEPARSIERPVERLSGSAPPARVLEEGIPAAATGALARATRRPVQRVAVSDRQPQTEAHRDELAPAPRPAADASPQIAFATTPPVERTTAPIARPVVHRAADESAVPVAELPAGGSVAMAEADPSELAERVYELIVRRLAVERERRGL